MPAELVLYRKGVRALSSEQEKKWIRAILRRGDRTAADALVRTYYDEIFAFVYRLTSIPYTEAVITLVLLLLSLGLCIVFIRRLQRRDILTA